MPRAAGPATSNRACSFIQETLTGVEPASYCFAGSSLTVWLQRRFPCIGKRTEPFPPGIEPVSTTTETATDSGKSENAATQNPTQFVHEPTQNDANLDAETLRLVHALKMLPNDARKQLLEALDGDTEKPVS